ncbi:CCA tRNA nucleotidyltransferase [Seohaeicola sp. SP36]|uniref:CCA tRNA nucleotidyltransferase n=1 Tax=unclassified Seohaeicola TaxID=2641111 RepID=UPI00237B7CA9|nr:MULTISPECIES: CCA tRNA nucleotidyltransferase [unclassified Seohaeicola]MDD9707831.1 CCA tRNA nucleotidyltransferase [Seohaeicola sp. 4SK31]MDD9734827.1 CCA tRNA nucleotidyltransferase [Seohaeicola sp. SP36]
MRIAADWIVADHTQAVCQMLIQAGYKSLFVGGCVRNAIIGAPVTDIDIATDARPEVVMELAKDAGLRPVPTGIEHGTVTVIAGGVPHEVTTFRRDVETDGRRAVVAFSTRVEDDARRRDFTMNALYADAAGTVLDPLGGLPDLMARRVRFIEDASARIAEDYLRILRFFRFHAWYGDEAEGLDPQALAAIAAATEGLAQLSRERVGAEVRKLLAAPDPAPSVAAMRACGVLTRILPGADDRALAPLIHLEVESGLQPDWLARLAALSGPEAAPRLRLSRSEEARLCTLRDGIGSMRGAGELGFRLGYDDARAVLLLRAAVMGIPIDPSSLHAAEEGAAAVFPVAAADLMPGFTGPALGRELERLKSLWIESGFRLSREDLLKGC